ncbi:hypothetical protein BSK59_15600 [Paenibacillus odorifer]|uniref:hypothetical protein n=1 Tax=Paenibacillus odorifer TaxID=189426 RepID=UPI00096F5E02|nr:hypothetical protein [Paenibacillus odorifer]OME54004.1 hypothetical protein BSK59_15600 [Paenibacillus odorifer]
MNKFKLAHAIAKVLKGDYSVRISYAWDLIKKNDFTSVSELIDLDTLAPKMYVSLYAEKVAKVPNKAPKQKRHTAKNISIVEPTQKIIHTGLPYNMFESFTSDQCNTVNEYINRYIKHANEYTGVHMDEKRFIYNDGMEALTKVYDIEGLQTVMITYFLRDYSLKVINKFLQMGIGYKKVNKIKDADKHAKKVEKAQSYQKASSNAGQIHEYSAMEIFHELVAQSYELTFNVAMFDAPSNVMQTLFFRISNVMQTQMTALKNQIKVKSNIKGMYNEYMDQSTQLDEKALDIAQEMDIFSSAEMEIIKLRIAGFQKNEIDKIIGKRTDRDFNRMKESFKKVV